MKKNINNIMCFLFISSTISAMQIGNALHQLSNPRPLEIARKTYALDGIRQKIMYNTYARIAKECHKDYPEKLKVALRVGAIAGAVSGAILTGYLIQHAPEPHLVWATGTTIIPGCCMMGMAAGYLCVLYEKAHYQRTIEHYKEELLKEGLYTLDLEDPAYISILQKQAQHLYSEILALQNQLIEKDVYTPDLENQDYIATSETEPQHLFSVVVPQYDNTTKMN